MAIGDVRQPQVFTQRRPLVFPAKQTTSLKLGNHALGKVGNALMQAGEHHVEAVRRTLFKPLLKVVSDGLRRANQNAMAACCQLVEQLPYRWTFATDQIEYQFLPTFVGVGIERLRR